MRIDGRKLRAMESERQMLEAADRERRAVERLMKGMGMTSLRAIGALELFRKKQSRKK